MNPRPWSFGERCDMAKSLARGGHTVDQIVKATGLTSETALAIHRRERRGPISAIDPEAWSKSAKGIRETAE